MSRFEVIVIGFLATFFSAWLGLVLLPVLGLGNFEQIIDPATGEPLVPVPGDLVDQGRMVYVKNGCMYCHSQQVRPQRAGADIARGWGERRTVARDYMNQKVALLGTMRTGPDLANVGSRLPTEDWHYLHLFDPQITSPGSIMPPFAFLFDRQPVDPAAGPSPEALNLPPEYAPPEGEEFIPSEDARALVAYLLSLQLSSQDIPEAEAARRETRG